MKHSDNLTPAILALWTVAACIVPNVWLSITEPYGMLGGMANVLLPLGLYTLAMSATRRTGRAVWCMLPVMFFAAFQLVLLYMYGRSVIAVDMYLNVVTTNPGEVGELLGNLTPIILAVCLIYALPLFGAVYLQLCCRRLTKGWIKSMRRTGTVVAIAGAVACLCASLTHTGYKPWMDLFPVNALYNIGVAVERTILTSHYYDTSAQYSYHAHATHMQDSIPEVYVAVIGETSRADHWGLFGYDRPTDSCLQSLTPAMALYPRSVSQSNTTHKSVPLLMSALDASEFGDSIYLIKSFITAFREAGYRTAFLSNQNRNHSFIDFFGEEADTCIFIREHSDSLHRTPYDTDLLPYFGEQLRIAAATGSPLLVVLHTYGSHFNYHDRYPREQAGFLPDGPTEANAANRDVLINAYDNTIALTARLLRGVADMLSASGCRGGIIYTSDHGEDIFDDSRHLFLHASPAPSYYQLHVPMLMWFTPAYLKSYPQVLDNARANSDKYVASSQSYFHSLMHMAGISTPQLNMRESLLSADYVEPLPLYVTDHNTAVSLWQSGLQQPDIKQFRSLGLRP